MLVGTRNWNVLPHDIKANLDSIGLHISWHGTNLCLASTLHVGLAPAVLAYPSRFGIRRFYILLSIVD